MNTGGGGVDKEQCKLKSDDNLQEKKAQEIHNYFDVSVFCERTRQTHNRIRILEMQTTVFLLFLNGRKYHAGIVARVQEELPSR